MFLGYYRALLSIVDTPGIKLRKPNWIRMPSAMFIYGLSYFLVTGGIIYDVIVIGSANDERGNPLPDRVNGQYNGRSRFEI